MAAKRGIIITGVVLAAITGASFLVWFVPVQNQTTFVISDYEEYLDGVKNIREVLDESIRLEYQAMVDGTVTPGAYEQAAASTSSQITLQIGEFVTSKPPEEWQPSYISYMESMKKFNQYVAETRVLASMIENGDSEEEIEGTVQKIEQLRSESQELARASDEARPR